jgi:hypothetical protein
MKEFPRIKRLSTLGIVHHQNFDYEFSAFRTDFVGEGGAGKSMIADILQLICVGPKAFHSPTRSTGPRKPHTMVLKNEGRGTDMGYAFINIEKKENQYLVIGIYLESSGISNMFIIQNDNNFNADTELVPFSRLLGVDDFQKNNTILPVNELKEHIQDNLQLTCEAWDRISNYHKILFNNNIFPFDLSLNYKELENYAKMLQAFSRESLNISESKSLQSFLFGDDKEKELIKKFNNTVEELNEDTSQFKSNLEEIESLTDKQIQLSNLLKLKNIKENDHQSLLKASYQYYNNLSKGKRSELKSKLNDYNYSLKSLPILKETITKKKESIKKEKKVLEPERDEVFKIKNLLKQKVDKRKKIFSWMQEFNCSIEDIVEKYNKYQESKDAINKINELKKVLKEKNILQVLVSNEYDSKHVLLQIEKQIEGLKFNLETKNKLKSLNDINDRNSLAYWALLSSEKLTLEQEAIIRKYQNKDIKAEIPSDIQKRYAPNPNELLNNIELYKKEKDGFWLNFKGVVEYFSTNFIQIFNTTNKSEIKEHFEQTTKDIQNEILNIKKGLSEKQQLKSILEVIEKPDDYIKAWNTYQDLSDQLETHEMYEMNNNDFNEYHKLYLENFIEDDYKKGKLKYDKLDSKWTKLNTLYENLNRTYDSFVLITVNNKMLEVEKKHNFSLEVNSNLGSFLSILNISKLEDYFTVFENIYNKEKEKYQIVEVVNQLDIEISDLTSSINKVYSQNPQLFKEVLCLSNEIGFSKLQLLDKKFNLTNNKYNQEYNLFVRQYIIKKRERFEDTGDFSALCKEVLPPEIFRDISQLEIEVIEKIDKYLRDINQKNKKLNNRKIQKLSVIIEEVSNEVSSQRNDIRQIHNFLNSEEKKITGGHKVGLDDDDEDTFSPGWMNVFTENINKDLGLGIDSSLFDTEKVIANDLEKYPALKDKLLEAFYRSGGSRKLKPKIEELLNPKSYYNVKFSIKTNKGKNNDGSTSQTYAAISLLCIGKLSLLNKRSKNKFVEAIRFMAIDEAAGLGRNFDMLYEIAQANDYQILSLSIKPNKVDAAKQNIYLLHNSMEDENVNYEPVPIFGLLNV